MFRKILKWIFILIFSFLGLNIIGYFALQNSNVQTFITKKATKYLKNNLNIDANISRVEIEFFNKLVLQDLLILDQKNDTLIYSKKLSTNILQPLNITKELNLKNISFDKTVFNLVKHPGDSITNLDWFIDKVDGEKKPGPSKKTKYIVDLNNISFENSVCKIKQGSFNSTFRVNSLNVKNIFWENDSLAINILPSCLSIDSLMNFNNIEGYYGMLGSKKVMLKNFKAGAGESYIDAEGEITFNSGKLKWFDKSTNYDLNINELIYNKKDIDYPIINKLIPKKTIHLHTNLIGNSRKLKVKDLKLAVNKSKLELNGRIKNVFNLKKMHLDFKIDKLYADSIVGLYYFKDYPAIKTQIAPIFPLFYKGKYKGNFILNESKGLFKTAIGNLKTDLQILFDPGYKNGIYFAKLDFKNFELNKLIKNNQFGKTSAFFDIEGEGLDIKDMDIKIQSDIAEFPFKNYIYKNVDVDGKISYNRYEGNLNLIDSNIALNFNGLVDLKPNHEIIDFTTKIKDAQLDKLNLLNSPNKISTEIHANFKGIDLDKSEGLIKIKNVEYNNQYGSYSLDSILIVNSMLKDSIRELKLKSSILDINAKGEFEIVNLYADFIKNLNPFLKVSNKNYENIKQQNYSAQIIIKKTDLLDSLTENTIKIADYSTINLEKEAYKIPSIQINSPSIKIDDKTINNLYLYANAKNDTLSLTAEASTFDLDSRLISIKNLHTNFKVNNNSIFSNLNWFAQFDSTDYSGNLFAQTKIDSNFNLYSTILNQSELYLADSLWVFDKNNKINYINNKLLVEDIKLSSTKQNILLNSFLNFDNRNELTLDIDNFNLGLIEPYLQKYNTTIDGSIFGEITIKDLLNTPKIYNNIIVDSLIVNGLWLGDLILENKEEFDSKRLKYLIDIEKNNFKILTGEADYNPELGFSSMVLNGNINKLRLDFLRPYIDEYIDKLSGKVNGKININKGEIAGKLELEKINFKLPLVGTRYNVEGSPKIFIKKDLITIPELKVNVARIKQDKNSINNKFGQAIVRGNIYHKEFLDYTYDLNADFKDFLAMSTKNDGNTLFFGEAIASGDLKMTGKNASPHIKIDASSEKGTDIKIFTTDQNEIAENSFIHFVVDTTKINKELKINNVKKESKADYEIDLNLKVNPSSNVSFNIDGSQLQGNGFGDLRLKIYSTLDFDLYGSFIVEKANYFYAFTESLIEKKFEIEKGGTVKWNGDPFTGIMDIKASYSTEMDLSAFDESEEEKKDVNANILLTGELLKPNVKFDILVPEGTDQVKSKIREFTNTEDKLAKQFISIVLLNSFYTVNEGIDIQEQFSNTLFSSGFGLLTSNFNKWLNENQDQFDIEFKFNPGTGSNLTYSELELILKKSFLNDRLHVNGNFGTPLGENTSNVKGDIDVLYDLRKDGNLKLKFFNKFFEDQTSSGTIHKQGIGLFYKYEFNNFLRSKKKSTNLSHKDNN